MHGVIEHQAENISVDGPNARPAPVDELNDAERRQSTKRFTDDRARYDEFRRQGSLGRKWVADMKSVGLDSFLHGAHDPSDKAVIQILG